MALPTKERFSLLLLEPGEIYFEDYTVYSYPIGNDGKPTKCEQQRGRLKMCSKSLVFDPADVSLPMLKLPYSECVQLEEWKGNLVDSLSAMGAIFVESKTVVEMMQNNIIAPYVFKRENHKYIFSLIYAAVDSCLPLIQQLRRASTLPVAEQNSMIATMVFSIQNRISFDTSWIEDLYEQIILETQGSKITPLVTNPGRILLTSQRLYFQPYNNINPEPVLKIRLDHITSITRQRFLLQQIGLQIFCGKSSKLPHIFLSLKDQSVRDKLYDSIIAQTDVNLAEDEQESVTLQWQNGVLSNYDYLLHLNTLAGRSFNDLTQYPVFPWVLKNYDKQEISMDDSSIYRDLSKPIGALNEERLGRLKERYNEMTQQKFLYGSHYSTPGFVLYYLVRKYPQYMLCLQNGRFDHPDRMFNSVPITWRNCIQNHSDFKELIPEFYDVESEGDFLINNFGCDFGIQHNGEKIANVALPNWAKTPKEFIEIHRQALESKHVSDNLNHWIDLIFGYKQCGKPAEEANNVFYHLCYEGSVDLQAIRDSNKRHAIEVQIMEFGQIPKQLFKNPHPRRFAGLPHPSGCLELLSSDDALTKKAELVRDMVSTYHPHPVWRGTVNIKVHSEFATHKEGVMGVAISSSKTYIFSSGKDGLLKMFSVSEEGTGRQVHSVNLSPLALAACMVFPDEKSVLVGSWDNNVIIYNIEFGRTVESVQGHNDAISCLAWHPERGLLVTGSWDTTAKLWHCRPESHIRLKASTSILAELDHDGRVTCVSLNKDCTKLLTGTDDGDVFLWDASTFELLHQLHSHKDVVTAVQFSPDDLKVISCGSDGFFKVTDPDTNTLLYAKDTGEPLTCIAWDGLTALFGSQYGTLQIWDLIAVVQVKAVKAHTGALTSIAASDDGRLVVTGGEDRRVVIWKIDNHM